MSTAGDKVVQELISKNTEMANDALKRLERGGLKHAQQHNDIREAPEHMNQNIEDTRANLDRYIHNTRQGFRARAAQVQQYAERCKQELKLFADEGDQALAHNAA